MIGEDLPPPHLSPTKGKIGGVDEFRNRMVADIPDKDVQALTVLFQDLMTVYDQSHKVTQKNHKDPPEAPEVQWEAVSI